MPKKSAKPRKSADAIEENTASSLPAQRREYPVLPRGSVTQDKDIIRAFSALALEYKAAQYIALRTALEVSGVPHIEPLGDLFKGLTIEQLGLWQLPYNPWTIVEVMEDRRHGQTFRRAVLPVWVTTTERPCTEAEKEERRRMVEIMNSRADNDFPHIEYDENFPWTTTEIRLANGPDDPEYPNAFPVMSWVAREKWPELNVPYISDEDRYFSWVEEYMAEVEVCVDRFRGVAELPRRMERLIADLRAFEIGQGEARPFMEKLRRTGAGLTLLGIMGNAKEELLQRLNEINVAATATTPKGAKTDLPRIKTLAERLDAVFDARRAFDDMLKIDGFANDAGQYVLKSRKGKGGILANWDAVVEHFGVEGFAHDAGLSEALCEYLPGLTVQKRIGKLREGNVYRDGLCSAKAYLNR